jgi:ADP-ribose pyrophosphatase
MRRILAPARTDYRNPFMEVRHTAVDFGAHRKDYYVIELGPRAGIVPVDDSRVLLTRQYRFLIDGSSWELPGGRVDDGETPETAAVRECIEETGVACRGLRKLIEYYPGLDNFNNRTTLFLSEDTETVANFEPTDAEVVEIRWFPLGEALEMVFSGRILDALTVSGLLAYEVRRAAPAFSAVR